MDCDGPNGRDNAVARLFKQLLLFDDKFSSTYQSEQADAGQFTVLLRVYGYNGQPNDTDVTLAIYSSPGLDEDPCLPSSAAQWDGTDAWPVDAITVNGMGTGGMGAGGGCGAAGPGAEGYDVDDPKYLSQQGYVTEGTLVVDLPQSALVFSSGNSATEIKLVGGFLTADLVEEANGWAMRNGVLTGRWRVADIFGILPTVEDGGTPICKDNALFGPVKSLLCNYPDITSSVVGAAAPCDALSFGMGFEAEAAQLGFVIEAGTVQPNPCSPDQDPSNDTCGM